MNKLYLGIDTSNYTTSLCISDGKEVVAEARRLLPVKKGEQGLRQSDALFHHTKALPELTDELFSKKEINRADICAVGVSSKPRDAEGSYMPCFLAGVSYATAFSSALDIPLYSFSHQCGHIVAAAISGNISDILQKSFISFHVSGGTTEIVYVTPQDLGLKCEIIGGTKDLNAGQAIDRCGVALGLGFPCGSQMDALSLQSFTKFSPRVTVKDGYCNLSGLENICKKMIYEGVPSEDICRFTFSYIAKTLAKMTEDVLIKYPKCHVLYAGGVMSNTIIREELSKISGTYFANPSYSCDNAFGTSCLAAYAFSNESDS